MKKKIHPRRARRNTKKGDIIEPLTSGLKIFYGPAGKRRDSLIARDEAFWNIAAYEREWRGFPEYCDFLSADSPVFQQKAFETEVYAKLMSPQVKKIRSGAKILDAGGGVGRFAAEFAAQGFEVHVADVSRRALLSARARLKKEGIGNVAFHLAEAENLDFLPQAAFSAALAIELVCYSPKPDAILKSVRRLLKPGGLLLISVENLLGALLGDGRLEPSEAAAALAEGVARVPGYLYVKYYSRKELRELLESNGFDVISIRGCQYTSSGPFDALARRALESGKKDELHEMERLCEADPLLRRLPRAWFAAARKA